MSILVTKSPPLIVGPCEATKTGTICPSSFDKFMSGIHITSFLVFDYPIHGPAESIKKALSQTLVHYYPIAGRLAATPNDGELTLACTGEGVLFVAASANCTLEDANFFRSPLRTDQLVKDLAVSNTRQDRSQAEPLMLMQVTEFSCGGFVVGAKWNHVIADGKGMAQFLQAIGELACGQSPLSVVPARWDDSLAILSPSIVATKPWFRSLDDFSLSSLDVTVPWSLISSIKSEYKCHFKGHSCTVFEVVTAILWQCRTRVAISESDAPAPLTFAVDTRKLVGAHDGYYGNCQTSQVVVATRDALASIPIVEVVKMIKAAKEKIPDMYKDGMVGWTAEIPMEEIRKLSKYNML